MSEPEVTATSIRESIQQLLTEIKTSEDGNESTPQLNSVPDSPVIDETDTFEEKLCEIEAKLRNSANVSISPVFDESQDEINCLFQQIESVQKDFMKNYASQLQRLKKSPSQEERSRPPECIPKNLSSEDPFTTQHEDSLGLMSSVAKSKDVDDTNSDSEFDMGFQRGKPPLSPRRMCSPRRSPSYSLPKQNSPLQIITPQHKAEEEDTSSFHHFDRGYWSRKEDFTDTASICVRDGSSEIQLPLGNLSSRKAHQLMALADYNKECTFKPKINPLPDMYKSNIGVANGETRFLDRQRHWEMRHMMQQKNLQTQELERKFGECTFTPKILQGCDVQRGDGYLDIAPKAQTQRLVDAIQQRREIEEAEFKKNCTFKPQILEKSRRLAEKMREVPTFSVRHATPLLEAADEDLQECTFKPKVTPYKPKTKEVQTYIYKNCFERLPVQRGMIVIPKGKEKKKMRKTSKQKKRKRPRDDSIFEDLYREAEEFRHHKTVLKESAMLKKNNQDPTSFKVHQEYFKPDLCKKSLKISNRRGLKFEERLEDSVTKRIKQTKNKDHSRPANSFISKGSRKIIKNSKTQRRKLIRREFTDKTKHEGNPVFKPKTRKINKKLLKNTSKLDSYLNEEVFERLADPKKNDCFSPYKKYKSRAKNSEEIQSLLEMEQTIRSESYVKQKQKITMERFTDFIDRQMQKECCRQKRINKMREEFEEEFENLVHENPYSPNTKKSLQRWQKTQKKVVDQKNRAKNKTRKVNSYLINEMNRENNRKLTTTNQHSKTLVEQINEKLNEQTSEQMQSLCNEAHEEESSSNITETPNPQRRRSKFSNSENSFQSQKKKTEVESYSDLGFIHFSKINANEQSEIAKCSPSFDILEDKNSEHTSRTISLPSEKSSLSSSTSIQDEVKYMKLVEETNETVRSNDVFNSSLIGLLAMDSD